MFKQSPLLRALRCATIVGPLAIGLGELDQLIVPHLLTLSTNVRAIRAAAIAGGIVLVFEAAMQVVYPHTSIWPSDAFSILFAALAAAAVTFVVLKKECNEALCRSEIQDRLLFDGNPVPMWVCDRKSLKFLRLMNPHVDNMASQDVTF